MTIACLRINCSALELNQRGKTDTRFDPNLRFQFIFNYMHDDWLLSIELDWSDAMLLALNQRGKTDTRFNPNLRFQYIIKQVTIG